MPVDTITPISDISQTANKSLADYLAEKKNIADEQAAKTAALQVAKVAQEVKDLKKIEDEKSEEAKLAGADQEVKYQTTKETNKQLLEDKYAQMDAVKKASASHFHAAEVNSKAARDKAIATIDQNTVALEDFLAAKTSTAEVKRLADNAAASDMVHSTILNSKSEMKQAVVAYHDNMATQITRQETVKATEAARAAGATALKISQEIPPTSHINVMD